MSILDSLTESRSQDANIRGELNTLVVRIGQIDADIQNAKTKIAGFILKERKRTTKRS